MGIAPGALRKFAFHDLSCMNSLPEIMPPKTIKVAGVYAVDGQRC